MTIINLEAAAVEKLIDLIKANAGTSQYIHIAYSTNGSTITTDSENAEYLGVVVTDSETAPTSYSDFTWTKIKGDSGTKWSLWTSNDQLPDNTKTGDFLYDIQTNTISVVTNSGHEDLITLPENVIFGIENGLVPGYDKVTPNNGIVLKLDGSWDYPITVRSQSTNPVLLLGSDSQPDTGISELNYTGISWDGDTTTCAISGTVNASGFYESSDENIKSNISNIEKSAKGIELKLFTFNSDKDTVKYGVIAQLLEEIGLDNLVSTDKLGLKSVDYISMLVLCIQDLRNEISDLKKLLGNL